MILLEQGHVTLWSCTNEVSAGDLLRTTVDTYDTGSVILMIVDPVHTYDAGLC